LCDTEFFSRFDVARDVIVGTIDKVSFTYFEHDRASGRSGSAVVRSIVAFETAPVTQKCDARSISDGWSCEKSGSRLFLWRWNDKKPKKTKEIGEFLRRALRVYQSLPA